MNTKTLAALGALALLCSHSQAQLVNISTRGHVGVGQQSLIAGFILTAPATIVIRGLGPSMEPSGVTDTLQDPVLSLFKHDDQTGEETPLWSNNNWQDVTEPFGDLAPGNPKEAAIRVTLQPGRYTCVLAGMGNTEGMALIEVYQVQ